MSISAKDKQIKDKALQTVTFALAQKAEDPVVIDVSAVSFVCDYFVVLSGESQPQVKAIYQEIIKKCKEKKITVHHSEADKDLRWMLIDLYDVVVHIFLRDVRAFYDIEHLWQEGKKIRLPKKIFEI